MTFGEIMYRPEFSFVDSKTNLFMTGVSMSGKSTIAPLVSAAIEGCGLQSMDIFRLLAQDFENLKPEGQRQPFVFFGSCDCYQFVGDGKYSQENLIAGFNAYARSVSSLLTNILPRMELQGVQNALFEGVQLSPSIVAPFLSQSNKLIIITSDEKSFNQRRTDMYAKEPVFEERYATYKLMTLQRELVRQGEELPNDQVVEVKNAGEILSTVSTIFQTLLNWNVVKKNHYD